MSKHQNSALSNNGTVLSVSLEEPELEQDQPDQTGLLARMTEDMQFTLYNNNAGGTETGSENTVIVPKGSSTRNTCRNRSKENANQGQILATLITDDEVPRRSKRWSSFQHNRSSKRQPLQPLRVTHLAGQPLGHQTIPLNRPQSANHKRMIMSPQSSTPAKAKPASFSHCCHNDPESQGRKVTSPLAHAHDRQRSMVQEVLEDFPADDDYEFHANFSQDINMEEIVCLDVGGDRYHIKRGCLTRLPHTRLGRLARCATLDDAKEFCDIPYNTKPPEFFFDRNGDNFSSILDVYRTNMFHLSSIGCALVLQKDLEYWGIDELMMEPCCALKYYPEIEICVNEKQGDLKERQREKEQAEEEDFGSSRWGLLRSWLWNTMEYPWTSRLAQFVAFFSLGMVILSTLTFIISTMEEFQAMDAGESQYTTVVIILDYIDTFVIVFFTLEYLIRFVCAPRKWRFFKNPMNLVDLFSIIPFYVSMFLHTLEDVMIIGKAGKIVRLIRVMRILRIFKLVRHFAGLQSLFLTLRQAYKELGLLMLLVAVAILTFSSLVYFAEKEAATNSWTFVESFWWGLMTITTVGYDLNPKTFLGKLLGGFCALSGIFILTLPIPIVVNSFASYYKNRLWRNEVAQKKRERAQAQSAEAKEMQKFYLLKAMAMPMTGQDMIAPNDAVVRAGIKAAKGLRH